MKRKDFIKIMNGAISRAKNKSGPSCFAIFSSCRKYSDCLSCSDIIHDYATIFRQNRSPFWLDVLYRKKISRTGLKQERIGMLELFEQVALDSKLYERY